MIHLGLVLRLEGEPAHQFRVVPQEELQRHGPLQAGIEGREDPAESSPGDETEVLVVLPAGQGVGLAHHPPVFRLRRRFPRGELEGWIIRVPSQVGSATRRARRFDEGALVDAPQVLHVDLVEAACVHQGIQQPPIPSRGHRLQRFDSDQATYQRHADDAGLFLLIQHSSGS